ncbi:MAG: glycosyltransferase family 4 protein, partial [Candidatus Moranbacteria bacterium]|nr:glycosyltransferase family 4 protein [Candidatus Moranbacteria bacterium]
IDGTRVYISQLLKYFHELNSEDEFLIYHKGEFNLELVPPEAENYTIKKINPAPFWTQNKFSMQVFRDNADTLWMPLHDLPMVRRKKMKTVVTAHDLAFKIFPETFPKKDLRKLNFLADYSFPHADKIIAISEATKMDLLKFYPKIKEEKIKVIHHGFDASFWQEDLNDEEIENVLNKFNLVENKYLIYIGAIQPRKNLKFLIKIFDRIKKNYPELKLVLAGGNGWMWQDIYQTAEISKFSTDIIFTENISFDVMRILLRSAKLFVLPSLYEGFGIPILEAMASGVPAVCANNSSLPEVSGGAVGFFETDSLEDCENKIENILNNADLQNEMIVKGLKRVKNFSWEKCAEETLGVLKS